jgi:hypothetical protein
MGLHPVRAEKHGGAAKKNEAEKTEQAIGMQHDVRFLQWDFAGSYLPMQRHRFRTRCGADRSRISVFNHFYKKDSFTARVMTGQRRYKMNMAG